MLELWENKFALTRMRQIVGFSMSPALALDVKKEAARRNISLRKLFEEMWELYKAHPRKKPEQN